MIRSLNPPWLRGRPEQADGDVLVEWTLGHGAVLVGLELSRRHLELDAPASVAKPGRLGRSRAQIPERDLLEEVRDQLMVCRARLLAQDAQEVVGARIGIGLEAMLADEAGKSAVDGRLSHRLLQGVHGETALLVQDGALVDLGAGKGPLEIALAAALQVAVEVELEEGADGRLPVLVLHDHERGVLGERFREHVAAGDIGRHDLVAPPLVRHLVGRDVGHHTPRAEADRR